MDLDEFARKSLEELDRHHAEMRRLLVEYLEERAKRGSREKFEAALARLPDVEPEDHDRL